MLESAAIRPGETLEFSVSPGAILITPKALNGRVVTKGKRKVYAGDVPDVNITDAVSSAP